MKNLITLIYFLLLCNFLGATAPQLRIAQLGPVAGSSLNRNYKNALPSLLAEAGRRLDLPVDTSPVLISSFKDSRLAGCPFLYINWGDRQDWDNMDDSEILALQRYLHNGGMVFLDGGITASFLRSKPGISQRHSYGEWQESPQVRDFFQRVLPGKPFVPLRRDDPLYGCCYQGLPDSSLLPSTVKDYTLEEKWPGGSYSAVAIRLNGHLSVVAMPIIAMGWGRGASGGWETNIRFRVLEGTAGVENLLSRAAALGERFQTTREDGGVNVVYCQENSLPAWIQEPGARWRVFKYYDSHQINDFAHTYYTRLGINILVAALLGM